MICRLTWFSRNAIQPDIHFIARPRLEIVKPNGVFGAPDLVVEITSPSSTRRDLEQKLALYARYAVKEYWIVDPEERTADIWTTKETPLDTRRVVAGDEGIMGSAVLPGLVVPLAEVFAGLEKQ